MCVHVPVCAYTHTRSHAPATEVIHALARTHAPIRSHTRANKSTYTRANRSTRLYAYACEQEYTREQQGEPVIHRSLDYRRTDKEEVR